MPISENESSKIPQWVSTAYYRIKEALRWLKRNRGRPITDNKTLWYKKPAAKWAGLILLSLVVGGIFASLLFTGTLALPLAAGGLLGTSAFSAFNIFFVVAAVLGTAALVSTLYNLLTTKSTLSAEEAGESKLLNAISLGARVALVATMTLTWVPFIAKGTLITSTSGSGVFQALFNSGGLAGLGSAAKLFAMVGIFAAGALVVAALGKLICELTADKLISKDAINSDEDSYNLAYYLHIFGKILSLGAIGAPVLLMLTSIPTFPLFVTMFIVAIIAVSYIKTESHTKQLRAEMITTPQDTAKSTPGNTITPNRVNHELTATLSNGGGAAADSNPSHKRTNTISTTAIEIENDLDHQETRYLQDKINLMNQTYSSLADIPKKDEEEHTMILLVSRAQTIIINSFLKIQKKLEIPEANMGSKHIRDNMTVNEKHDWITQAHSALVEHLNTPAVATFGGDPRANADDQSTNATGITGDLGGPTVSGGAADNSTPSPVSPGAQEKNDGHAINTDELVPASTNHGQKIDLLQGKTV